MLRPTAMGNMNSVHPRSIFKTDQKRSKKYRFDTSGTSHQTLTPGIPGSPVISSIIIPLAHGLNKPLYILINQPMGKGNP